MSNEYYFGVCNGCNKYKALKDSFCAECREKGLDISDDVFEDMINNQSTFTEDDFLKE